MLRSPEITQQEKEKYLSRIERNGDQLLHLIDDILDLSRIEAQQMKISCDSFSLRLLLKEIHDSLIVLIDDKTIKTHLEISDELPNMIVSDYMRMRQILMNLVSNASKFTDSGEITIRALSDTTEGHFRIEVEDTGIGMDDDVQKQLFKHFSQGDVSVTRKYGGSGLGLALSQKIAKILNGKLLLHKSIVGKGSTFVALFPFENKNKETSLPASTASTSKQVPRKSLEGLRVLLAEDSPDNRTLISIYLQNTGVDLTIVNDGVEAVQAATLQEFDLILMDIQMPGLDGLQATRQIRESGYSGPILALTAHALQEEIQKSLQWGCDHHLTKPISRPDLISAIHQFQSFPSDSIHN